mmetsp:Transcript_88740/g.140231  ORF Transcript_88740/g.140231 Transcript_88740/m.140231 type:complete len:216 (+) Transcript_88740:1569-2216(+)
MNAEPLMTQFCRHRKRQSLIRDAPFQKWPKYYRHERNFGATRQNQHEPSQKVRLKILASRSQIQTVTTLSVRRISRTTMHLYFRNLEQKVKSLNDSHRRQTTTSPYGLTPVEKETSPNARLQRRTSWIRHDLSPTRKLMTPRAPTYALTPKRPCGKRIEQQLRPRSGQNCAKTTRTLVPPCRVLQSTLLNVSLQRATEKNQYDPSHAKTVCFPPV